MSKLGDDQIAAVMDCLFGGATLTPAAQHDIALSLTEPADDGSSVTEPAGGAYARVTVTNNDTTWPDTADRMKTNGIDLTFPAPTGAWGQLGWFVITNHTGGAYIGSGRLATRISPVDGDTVLFAAGDLLVNGPGS